jgi:hypothetical protein
MISGNTQCYHHVPLIILVVIAGTDKERPGCSKIRKVWLSDPSSSISFPEHARSQIKGGHSSGEIELIQACDWLAADSIR